MSHSSQLSALEMLVLFRAPRQQHDENELAAFYLFGNQATACADSGSASLVNLVRKLGDALLRPMYLLWRKAVEPK